MATKRRLRKMESHCNKCGGDRTHDILYHHLISGKEYIEALGDDRKWQNDYYFLKCAGCGSVSLREDTWDDLFEVEETKLLPPPSFRPKPSWMAQREFKKSCPSQLRALIKEMYISVETDCRRSAAMCIRAILETIMIDKVGDQGAFSANLTAFVKQGFLSENQRKTIEPVLEAGHAVIHRNFEPNRDQLVVLIDVMEAVLATTYLHPLTTASLQAGVPERNRATKAAGP